MCIVGCGRVARSMAARAAMRALDPRPRERAVLLNGILFIDRMSRAEKDELKPLLEELQAKTKAALKEKK